MLDVECWMLNIECWMLEMNFMKIRNKTRFRHVFTIVSYLIGVFVFATIVGEDYQNGII